MNQFDLGILFQKAFGITLPKYDLNSQKASSDQSSKYGSSIYRKTDAMGRYYFMPVELGGLELQYPVIRIQGRKILQETVMTERKGSVIEGIAMENYRIYIRGFMVDHGGLYPEDQIYALKEAWERNESLPLRSVLTDIFLESEDRVVITDFSLPEVKGVEHVKPYEINLVSDSIFTLEIE